MLDLKLHYQFANQTGAIAQFINEDKDALLMTQRVIASDEAAYIKTHFYPELFNRKAFDLVSTDVQKFMDVTRHDITFVIVTSKLEDLNTQFTSYEEYVDYCRKRDLMKCTEQEFLYADEVIGIGVMLNLIRRFTHQVLIERISNDPAYHMVGRLPLS